MVDLNSETVLSVAHIVQEMKQPFSQPKTILQDISFQIPRGSITGFAGLNGAGKTTTLKTILEFIPKKSGEILFFNQQRLSEEVRNYIGFLPERPYFYNFLTGKEFLKLHWDLHFGSSNEFEKRSNEVLNLVDLERAQNQRLSQYSKGMLQRIGIAQSIIHNPAFLIWDEPMSGLDPDGRSLVKNIMKNLNASGVTIFFSSHLLQDMQELCDRIVIIDKGKIVFQGEKNLLLQSQEEKREIAWCNDSKNPKEIKKEIISIDNLNSKIQELIASHAQIQWIEKIEWSLEEAFAKTRLK